MTRRLAGVLLGMTLAGCTVPIGRFSAIGNPDSGGATGTPTPTHGESCHWWVLGVTLGVPRIEEAVADALANAGATGALRDASLASNHPVYGPLGKHCYTISGTAWRTAPGQ